MELEALIRILVEKHIIKEIGEESEPDLSVTTYKFEYHEVWEKILSAEFDNYLFDVFKGIKKNTFCFIDVVRLRNKLEKEMDKDAEWSYITPISNLQDAILLEFFPEDDEFHLEESDHGTGIVIVNDKLIREKEEKEAKRKQEVIDFLNSLP